VTMAINRDQTREVTESSGNRFPGLSILSLFLVLFIVPCQGIDTGFGKNKTIKTILINGINGSERDLLMSELLSREGDILSGKNMEADCRHLNRLGLFRPVEIKSVPNGDEINLEIPVVPKARYLPLAYMGTSEDNRSSFYLFCSACEPGRQG
jgi:Surface antigen variable number repeat